MKLNVVLIVILIFFSSTAVEGQKKRKNLTVQDTMWMNDALIYRINFADFEPVVTFKDWTVNIDNIKDLGFNVISIGCIQSYSRDSTGEIWIRDFNATDYRLGKVSNLKTLVAKAHELGLKIIMDWIPDRLAADHQWRVEHPNWFKLDSNSIGSKGLPELDFTIPEVQLEMESEMSFWVKNCNIDGFNILASAEFESFFWRGIARSLGSNNLLFAGDTCVVGLFSGKMILRDPDLGGMIHLAEQREVSIESLIHFIESNIVDSKNKILIDLFTSTLEQDDPFRHAKLVFSFALNGIPQFSDKLIRDLASNDSLHFQRCIRDMSAFNTVAKKNKRESIKIIRDPGQTSVLILKRTRGELSNIYIWNLNSAPVRIQANILAKDEDFINILESEPHLFKGLDRSFIVPGFDCLYLKTQ